MYVPGRNTIFISIAFSIAENLGINMIWHGADYTDRLNFFPDCYQEYFVAFNELLQGEQSLFQRHRRRLES